MTEKNRSVSLPKIINPPCFFNIQTNQIPTIEDDTPTILRKKYLNNNNSNNNNYIFPVETQKHLQEDKK